MAGHYEAFEGTVYLYSDLDGVFRDGGLNTKAVGAPDWALAGSVI